MVGGLIFNLSTSFQIDEYGPEYQEKSPKTPYPSKLKKISDECIENLAKTAPEKLKLNTNIYSPFELKPIEALDLEFQKKREPSRHMWLRTINKLPDDPQLHRSMLAYISNFSILDTNLLPHRIHNS